MEKRRLNYVAKIDSIHRGMINEMWSIIEKRAKTDDRYQAPRNFQDRTFENDKEICEVDYDGHGYGVKGIRVEQHWGNHRSVSIIAHDGNIYSGLDVESVCVLLSALRRQKQRKPRKVYNF